MLLTAEGLGLERDKISPFFESLEMIHTYSLIHDDLPAMDNDDLRRGKPTNHKKFGEAMAILAGDALLNYAFENVLNKADRNNIASTLEALKYLGFKSGMFGMIQGQVLDTTYTLNEMNDDMLYEMILLKTVALIEAAVTIPFIIAERSELDIKNIEEFARSIGLAFQIRDDILDYTEDVAINKATYATKYGVQEANKKVENLTKQGNDILENIRNFDSSRIVALSNILINRSY